MQTSERKTLARVAEWLDSATERIGALASFLQGKQMDHLELAGIPGNVLWLKENFAAIDDSLQEAHFFISDDWPSIERNHALQYELRCFADTFDRFCRAVTDLDNSLSAKNPARGAIFADYEASREYAILAGRYSELLKPAFDYARTNRPGHNPRTTPLQGLCEDLKDFFTGLTDSALEDSILKGLPAGAKGQWNGTLTQATFFGQHFGITAEKMNKLFFFHGGKGLPAKAHYTRYPATNIKPTDYLPALLSKYPRKA